MSDEEYDDNDDYNYEEYEEEEEDNKNNYEFDLQEAEIQNTIKKQKQPTFYKSKEIYENIIQNTIKQDIQQLLQLDFDQCLLVYQHYQYNYNKMTSNIFNEMETVFEKYGLKFEAKNQQLKIFEGEECPSCFGDESTCSKLPCGHQFCDDCISQYVSLKVTQNIIYFSCLQEGCNYTFRSSVIQEFMDKEIYLKKLVDNFVDKNKEIVQCPGADCEYALDNRGYVFQYVTCYCNQSFCAKCLKEMHQPAPCDMLIKWKTQTDQDDLNLKWISSNAKICPNCKRAVQRSLGCDYMHCAPPGGCGKSFCYQCEIPLTEAEHGSHASCRKQSNLNQKEQKQQVQELLKKVNFYYDKFKTCEVVQEKAQKYLEEEVENMRADLFTILKIPLSETAFLETCLRVLILSRDALKYSYVFSFNIPHTQAKTKELFQFYQNDYEKQTEGLAMGFEVTMKNFMISVRKSKDSTDGSQYVQFPNEFQKIKSTLNSFSEAVNKSKKNMIEAVELGSIYID